MLFNYLDHYAIYTIIVATVNVNVDVVNVASIIVMSYVYYCIYYHYHHLSDFDISGPSSSSCLGLPLTLSCGIEGIPLLSIQTDLYLPTNWNCLIATVHFCFNLNSICQRRV